MLFAWLLAEEGSQYRHNSRAHEGGEAEGSDEEKDEDDEGDFDDEVANSTASRVPRQLSPAGMTCTLHTRVQVQTECVCETNTDR